MTIIVEDGTIVDGANSYVTVSGVTDYAIDHGYQTTWSGTDITDNNREEAVHKAMRYIESLDFRGIRQTKNQSLQFPRSEVIDNSGYEMDENFIPKQLVSAVCEAAMLMLPGSDFDLQPNINKDSYQSGLQVTGTIQEVWNFDRTDIRNRSTIIEDLLKEFLKNKLVVEIKRG